MDFLNMDLSIRKFSKNWVFNNFNKLSDGHGNIVFAPLGHRQKYGNAGFCVNIQIPEPQ